MTSLEVVTRFRLLWVVTRTTKKIHGKSKSQVTRGYKVVDFQIVRYPPGSLTTVRLLKVTENPPNRKGRIRLPTIIFQGQTVKLQGCSTIFGSPLYRINSPCKFGFESCDAGRGTQLLGPGTRTIFDKKCKKSIYVKVRSTCGKSMYYNSNFCESMNDLQTNRSKPNL